MIGGQLMLWLCGLCLEFVNKMSLLHTASISSLCFCAYIIRHRFNTNFQHFHNYVHSIFNYVHWKIGDIMKMFRKVMLQLLLLLGHPAILVICAGWNTVRHYKDWCYETAPSLPHHTTHFRSIAGQLSRNSETHVRCHLYVFLFSRGYLKLILSKYSPLQQRHIQICFLLGKRTGCPKVHIFIFWLDCVLMNSQESMCIFNNLSLEKETKKIL